MMMVRSYVARWIAASLVLVLMLAACGTEDPTATPTSEATPTPTATTPPDPDGPTPMPTTASENPTPTPTEVPGFDAEEYFSGQTIRFVSISPPGGGTDTQARVIASRWAEFLPGNPRLVVSDIPRVAGYNYMHQAEPDGFTIMYQASPGIEYPLRPGTNFDTMSDFVVVAAVGVAPQVWVGVGDLPYDSLEEAIDSDGPPLRFAEAVGGPTDMTASALTMVFLCDRLNLPCEPLRVSEAGTNSQLLMMERGETNSNLRGALWWNLATLRPGEVEAGNFKALARVGPPNLTAPPHPEFTGDIMNPYDLLDERGQADFRLITYPPTLYNKAIGMPPGSPPHLVNYYLDAFRAAMEDEDFEAALSQAAGLPVGEQWLPHEEIQPVFSETADEYIENVSRLEELQNELYPLWQ